MRPTPSTYLARFQGVHAMLEVYPEIAPSPQSTPRLALSGAIVELEHHLTTQATGAVARVEARNARRAARRTLLADHIRPIVEVARHAGRHLSPLGPLTMPGKRILDSDARLVAFAKHMADRLEWHRAVFVEGGLALDFIEQLREASHTLDGAVVARYTTAAAVTRARSGVKAALDRGRGAVRVLNAILLSKISDAGLLAEWRYATRATPVDADPVPALATSDTASGATSGFTDDTLFEEDV